MGLEWTDRPWGQAHRQWCPVVFPSPHSHNNKPVSFVPLHGDLPGLFRFERTVKEEQIGLHVDGVFRHFLAGVNIPKDILLPHRAADEMNCEWIHPSHLHPL